MAVALSEQLRGDLSRLVHSGASVRDFTLGAARILARAVPFDGVCLVTTDPATQLPTGEVIHNALPQAARARMAELELRREDFNTFHGLARSGRRAASLSEATGGDLDRSQRHRELKRPNGFGDELRVVLVSEAATWGGLTLLRASDRGNFAPADVAGVASVSPYLVEGLRRALLLSALSAETEDREERAGLALLAPDNSVTLADAAAETWLDEMRRDGSGEALPPAVTAVASRARSIANGEAPAQAVARARVRTESGRWLIVHGSTLGGNGDAQTAVTLEPAGPHELAPLIAAAYELTERERAVTQLVARGLPTNAIAERLQLSPWTVQDHLKSIFEKVGVGTRGELVARLFFDYYAPRLAATLAAPSPSARHSGE
jgi:DNA-binding CsgD family transcriptional regulator